MPPKNTATTSMATSKARRVDWGRFMNSGENREQVNQKFDHLAAKPGSKHTEDRCHNNDCYQLLRRTAIGKKITESTAEDRAGDAQTKLN